MNYREKIQEINPDAILWDDLDECIIGITNEGKAVYDIHKMELHFQKQDNIPFEDAVDWVEFNILGAYVGDFTPVHVWVIPDEK